MKKYKFIDLFAGCGGLEDGFLQSGRYIDIAAVEWLKPQVNTLIRRLETKWKVEDAAERVMHFDIQRETELFAGWDDEKFGSGKGLDYFVNKAQGIDVIIGGPPCQAYSIAGRVRDENGMRDDYRNYLFEHYLSVVNRYRPTVTVFLTLLRLLCKKPLMGRMLKEEKNLTGKVKGKIVIEKNIRANTMHGRNDRFYCQYLQFSEDIIENQILKAALKKSKRFVIEYFKGWGKDNNNYTSMISYCSNALRNISDIQCDGEACNGLKFSGCYIYYKPVMAMAKMVLDDISIESNGDVSTTGYILPYAISMEKLFEVYVRAYFKKNGIASYRSKSNTGIRLEKYDNKTDVFLEEEGLENPGKYISGSIKPDLILTDQESGETMVLDVKYKDYRNGDSRDDRLQLLAYSMMMNANNIGIILPAQDEVEIFDARRINSMENRVVKYHQMLLGVMKDNPVIANYIKTNAFKKKE